MLIKVNKLIFPKEICLNHRLSNFEILQNVRSWTDKRNEKRGREEGEKPIVHPREIDLTILCFCQRNWWHHLDKGEILNRTNLVQLLFNLFLDRISSIAHCFNICHYGCLSVCQGILISKSIDSPIFYRAYRFLFIPLIGS